MRNRQERQAARREHVVQEALAYSQCPHCSFDLATAEGERDCHYYECPYLPDLLNAICPDCRFNFFTGEGDASCGDPPRCEFARNEAPARVDAITRWLELHGQALS